MPRTASYLFKATDRFSRVARTVRGSSKRVQASFTRLGASATAASAKVTQLGTKMKATSLVAAAGVVASLKTFGDLEKGITNVLTLLDSPAEIQQFSGEFKKLSEGAILLGFSTADATKGLFDVVSALGAGEKATEAFKAAQILAIGGVTDLATAGDGITSIMNAYADENLRATDISNAFFSSQKKGKTTVALLAANIGKVAPIARSAGIGYKELLAATAQLTLGGLSTEEATTSLKGAITALINPGKDAQKVLTKLGVPFGVTQIKAAGFTKVLQKLNEASEKYPDLLTRAIPGIRGYTAVASLSAAALKNMDNIQKQMNLDIAANRVETEAAAAQMATFNFEMGRTFGAVKILGARIGESLAPAIKFVGKVVRGLIAEFDSWNFAVKRVVAVILAIVAVAAPVLLIMGKLGAVVGGIATLISGSFVAVGLAVAAIIAGIILAVGLLIFKFDLVKEKFLEAVGAVKGFFGFGDADVPDMTGTANLNQSTQTQIDLNLNAPKGIIESVKSKTVGDKGGLNLGINMAEAL